MSPYIILKDRARTSSIDSTASWKKKRRRKKNNNNNKHQDSSYEDFMSYVDSLLSKPHRNSSTGLIPPQLSPTVVSSSGGHSRRGSMIEELSAKEAIDLAILRGNTSSLSSSSSGRSANRFEVARNGRRVAVLTLGRPAYRLGETIIAVVDFSNAEIPCYALHAALETSETVDPAIALRSAASVHRVTRRTHGSHSESTLFARRVVFAPTIPVTATPEFATTGVSLEWKMRVEFVTPKISSSSPSSSSPGGGNNGNNNNNDDYDDYYDDDNDDDDDDDDDSAGWRGGGGSGGGGALLEEVQRDDRGGVILAAVESMACESFEVAVPVRVYGAVVGGVKDEGAGTTEGFAV
ncbi:hypothetical protein GP486_008616 [Trichoglossum hirsutum]|uniref:Uncharacterized protein n=1 Tax=Trichoglossum hirsutum TaxID=265104 RepID=A0A9P8L449_9PEZI|nr:hypothetical protein GP486_008616 [Trichoglossum hirsutum]